MAAPTVELGLGGSLLALALADFDAIQEASGTGSARRLWAMDANPVDGDPNNVQVFGIGVRGNALELVPLDASGHDITVAGGLPESGRGVQLNGTSGYMVSTAFSNFAPGATAWTLEVVLTVHALPGGGTEPTIAGKTDGGFGLNLTSGGIVRGYLNGVLRVSSVSPIATGVNVHLALTYAKGSPNDAIALLVNGVSVATATPVTFTPGFATLILGKHWTNAHFLSATYAFCAEWLDDLSAPRLLTHAVAVTWTDVTTDTLGEQGLTYERGIRDDKPSNRVAATGTLTWSMNNLGSNSGGVTGYYSPGHASCRAGFTKGVPVRVKTGSDVQFIGRVRTIAPAPGKSGNGVVKVMATDFIDQCALFLMEATTILEDVRGDEVFGVIVAMLLNQPNGVTASHGSDTYPLVLDNTRDEAVSALAEFHRLAVSELGYVYVTRQGVLVYEARSTRIGASPTSSVTLADTMNGLEVADVSADALNRVQITVHPRVVDTAATTVLYAIANPLSIAAGETKTIIGPYRTPSVPGVTTRVGGLDMVTPVATTDYLMNTLSDGTGTNLTTSLSVVSNFGPNGVQLVLTNGATQPAFITLLQCRGKGVYDFRTTVVRAQDDAAIAADGVNALTLDMVYQQDPNVAQSLADYLLAGYGDLTGARVKRVEMLPDKPGIPAGLLTKDISDRVTVNETVTGASGDYYINGVKHAFQNGTLPKVTWWLSPAAPQAYWILDLVGASELDSNAVLAP